MLNWKRRQESNLFDNKVFVSDSVSYFSIFHFLGYFILEFIFTFLISFSLFFIFLFYEVDSTQFFIARILPFHVVSAWLSFINYLLLLVLSIGYIIVELPFLFLVAKQISFFGLVLLLFTLFSGIFWAYCSWGGTSWSLDTRFFSVFLLFFLYLGYVFITNQIKYNINRLNLAFFASLLVIFAGVDIPIIKISVDWWNTLHQAQTFKELNSVLHFILSLIIFILFFSFILSFLLFVLLGIRFELIFAKSIFLVNYIDSFLNFDQNIYIIYYKYLRYIIIYFLWLKWYQVINSLVF